LVKRREAYREQMGKKRSKGIIHNFKGNASRSKKGEEGEEVEDLQTELNQEIKERDWNKNQNKNVYQDFQKVKIASSDSLEFRFHPFTFLSKKKNLK